MEGNISSYVDPIKDYEHGTVMSNRDIPPAHYTFQINSFSALLESKLEKCESGDFEVEGYKWKMILYPNGDRKRDAKANCHISLYLALSDTTSLPLNLELKVFFRFFLFDQIRDKYLAIQDGEGKVRRFYKMKSEWGITQLISHDAFNEASNGYLIDDCCVFGVEVFVIKQTGKGECLTIMKEPQANYFSWYIYGFSKLDKDVYYSEVFTVKGRKWKLMFYPKGTSSGKSTSISLFLELDESENMLPGKKVYARYNLRLRNRISDNHFEKTVEKWFTTPGVGYGYPEFLPLSDIKDKSQGYLVDDSLIIEVKILFLSMAKDI